MRLNHHRRGRGEPLLLLHGIGHHWQGWAPVLPLLAGEREVVAVDLPGFGGSLTLREDKPSVPTLARAVRAFAQEHLGWETAHLGGSSLGGAIALELARGGFARSVCALAPVGFHSAGELSYTRWMLRTYQRSARLLAPAAGPLMRLAPLRGGALAPMLAHPTRMPAGAATDATRNLASALGWHDTVRGALHWRWPGGDVDVPVTIAWGTRDYVLPYRQAARARAELPSARHVRLDGLGHVPMWEDPERVAALLLGR